MDGQPTNFPASSGPGSNLNADQIARARELWDQGGSLGEIAHQIGCNMDDLSPWLYRDAIREAFAQAGRR